MIKCLHRRLEARSRLKSAGCSVLVFHAGEERRSRAPYPAAGLNVSDMRESRVQRDAGVR
jgi:hypothetical protein